MKILNKTKNIVIINNAKKADTPIDRMIGLLNRKSLKENEGLIITKCNSIHMFFMKFPIDAIFVDNKDKVVGLVQNIPPFALSPIFFKANYVIEVSAGIIKEKNIEKNDQMEIIN